MSAVHSPDVCAERRVRDAYRALGWGDRFHVAVRWRSCPFPQVEQHVPRAGRVLDLGCGHGAFALYLAATAPDRVVTGVDVDEAKLTAARQAAAHADLRVRFVRAVEGTPPDGPWDAITVVDVLYLLGRVAALALVADAARRLAPGGALVVKEIDVQPRWKYELTRAQEFVSTRITRITEGTGVSFVPPGQLEAAMVRAGLAVERVPLGRGSLHPHLLVVGRREADHA